MLLKYDFHIHSCLSPCADSDMTPANIAAMAMLAGYDIIALSDHNTTKNCPAFIEACKNYGITGFPAMELNTSEEVHILCIFSKLDDALAFDEYVYERLPDIKNRPEFFGEQTIMDSSDQIIGHESKLLTNATGISVNEVASLLKSYNAIAIPAHIDRDSFSLISNLGIVDFTLGFDLVELSPNANIEDMLGRNPELLGLKYIINSDAHTLTSMPDALHTIYCDDFGLIDPARALQTGKHIPLLGSGDTLF